MQIISSIFFVNKIIPIALLMSMTLIGCASQKPVKIPMQAANLEYFKDGLDIGPSVLK